MYFPEQLSWVDLRLAIITLVCAVTFCVILQKIMRKKPTMNRVAQTYESCKSPDCVRCAKFHDLLHISYGRLQDFLQTVSCKNRVNCVDKDTAREEDAHDTDHKRITESFTVIRDSSVANSSNHGNQNTGEISSDDSGSILGQQQPTVFRLLNLPSEPWWDQVYVSDMNRLKASLRIIKAEFKTAFRFHNERKFWTINSTPSGKWSVFSLVNQGCVLDDHVNLCPNTWSLIQSLECFMSGNVFGNAVFSVIFPDTVITEHFGPTNIRVRCHLGLDVPSGCFLTVDETSRNWIEGDCLLFDDSFLHAAQYTPGSEAKCTGSSQNSQSQTASTQYDDSITENKELSDKQRPRAVLMLDLWHPNLTTFERESLSYVFSSESL